MAGPAVVAADIGGTQMRAAIVGADGAVLLRRTAPTPRGADVPAALIDLIAAVADEAGRGETSHAVVGLPGGVDYEAGRLLWAPHLPAQWPDRLSRDELRSRLGLDVHVANDADMAAVGEAYFGAGAASRDVAYLTISTGIGSGVVHGRKVVRGRRSLAEVGHTVIDWHAWRAGGPSTLEELGSGSGMATQARSRGLGDLDARGLKTAAADGDPGAAAIWDDAIAACAAGLSNLVMSFYPDTVVVGGGLGRREDFFTAVRDRALARAEHHPPDLEIVRTALGDDAGLAGAAGWAAAVGPA